MCVSSPVTANKARQIGAKSCKAGKVHGADKRVLPGWRYKAIAAPRAIDADELVGEADQDRREGGEPRTLRRLPNGGGRHPTTNVPGDSADDRGTTAATTTPRQHEAFDCHAFKRNRQEECVQMPEKITRSAPRPSFGLPRAAGSHPTSRLTSRDAAKSLLSTLVSESSGESRLMS
jgi:hypothetical protein